MTSPVDPQVAGQPKAKDVTLPPGDRVALRWLVGGVLFYPLFAALLYGSVLDASGGDPTAALLSLIGFGDQQNPAMAILVLGGLLVFGAAVLSAIRDWRKLRSEELDVEWVLRYPDGAGLVFAPSDKREVMYRTGKRGVDPGQRDIETLMDDRVRRIINAEHDRDARVSPDDLRRLAESRLAALGADGRFGSGLLLLLAVLGTFAGVKASLPRLINAVSSASNTFGNAAIAGPLETVAAAFGANSLALVGAISLGIIAHGLVAGRRNLLDRMERASEPLYRGVQRGNTLDPLAAAVDALVDTGTSMKQTGASLQHLDAGITNLSATFTDAFERLSQELGQLSVQQQQLLTEQTAAELQRLQERVAQMGEIVDANTRLYQGLVESLSTRSRESQELVTSSVTAIRRLDDGLRSIISMEERVMATSEALDARAGRLDGETEHFAQRVELASEAVDAVGPALQEFHASLERTVQTMLAQGATRQEEMHRATQTIVSDMSDLLTRNNKALSDSMANMLQFTTKAFADEMRSMAQRAALRQDRPDAPMAAVTRGESFASGMAQGVGIVMVVGLGALVFRIASSIWSRF